MSSDATRRLQQTFIGCLCCTSVRLSVCPDSLTYFGDLLRRTAPKFGTHVRIDTITLHLVLTHPTQGGLGGYLLLKNLSQRTAPKFGKHVRIHTLTFNCFVYPPHPRGFRGLSCLARLALARERTPSLYTSEFNRM